MEQSDRDKLYLERMLKHQEQTKEGKFYAIKRIDLMVVSISGAGIYIIFEMIKFFYEKEITNNLWAVKLSGCLFAAAIIINFFSQWTGYEANRNEIDSSEFVISEEKGDKIDKEKHGVIKNRIKTYNQLTAIFNGVSTVLMLAGVLILVVYNLFIF